MVKPKQSPTRFLSCRNCGRYIKQEKAYSELFCSRACAVCYRCCPNCGRYFLPSQKAERCCSQECTTIYKIKLSSSNLYEDLEFS